MPEDKQRDFLEEKAREELEAYIQTKEGWRIYNQLRLPHGSDLENFQEALQFFRILNESIAFIEKNKGKPLLVRKYYERFDEDEFPGLEVLYPELKIHFAERKDVQIDICLAEIDQYLANHENKYLVTTTVFSNLLERVNDLPDPISKIRLLIEEKAKFNRNRPHDLEYEQPGAVSFIGKCDIEIRKYKELLELEVAHMKKPIYAIGTDAKAGSKESEEYIGKPKLTVDQWIMLIYAIGGSRIKGLDKNKVAIGLSALTGFTDGEFIKKQSNVLPDETGEIKKLSNHPSTYKKDVKAVCEILAKMGLPDEVKKLENYE